MYDMNETLELTSCGSFCSLMVYTLARHLSLGGNGPPFTPKSQTYSPASCRHKVERISLRGLSKGDNKPQQEEKATPSNTRAPD